MTSYLEIRSRSELAHAKAQRRQEEHKGSDGEIPCFALRALAPLRETLCVSVPWWFYFRAFGGHQPLMTPIGTDRVNSLPLYPCPSELSWFYRMTETLPDRKMGKLAQRRYPWQFSVW